MTKKWSFFMLFGQFVPKFSVLYQNLKKFGTAWNVEISTFVRDLYQKIQKIAILVAFFQNFKKFKKIRKNKKKKGDF